MTETGTNPVDLLAEQFAAAEREVSDLELAGAQRAAPVVHVPVPGPESEPALRAVEPAPPAAAESSPNEPPTPPSETPAAAVPLSRPLTVKPASAAKTTPQPAESAVQPPSGEKTGRIYAAMDCMLGLLNRPVSRVKPGVRRVLGQVAILTICISLAAHFARPWLRPESAGHFLDRKLSETQQRAREPAKSPENPTEKAAEHEGPAKHH